MKIELELTIVPSGHSFFIIKLEHLKKEICARSNVVGVGSEGR